MCLLEGTASLTDMLLSVKAEDVVGDVIHNKRTLVLLFAIARTRDEI